MKKLIGLLIICLFLFSTCQKENIKSDVPDQGLNKALIDTNSLVCQKIKELGFSLKNIIDIGDSYLVEGDVLFPKSLDSDSKLKQARTKYLIPWDKQPNITIRFDASIPASGEDNWRDAVINAISQWNNIPNSRIHFTLTAASTADITIRDDAGALSDGQYVLIGGVYYWVWTLAAAQFPLMGQPGYQIRINLNTDNNRLFTDAQKIYNMVHEIGHCIGFRHTNWQGLGEGTGGINDGLHNIPGTPTGNNPDPASVMNGGTALNSWNGFSTNDIIAAQYLFGQGRRVVLKTSNGYYIQAVNGGGSTAVASSSNPWEWETFHLMVSPLWGSPYYVLQTIDGGYYLQAANGGGGNVVANSLNPWEWETFELIPSVYYPGKYNLKTKRTGQYLQAVNGGGGALVANSANPWEWESFEILDSWF